METNYNNKELAIFEENINLNKEIAEKINKINMDI